jgi:hypothetical protein
LRRRRDQREQQVGKSPDGVGAAVEAQVAGGDRVGDRTLAEDQGEERVRVDGGGRVGLLGGPAPGRAGGLPWLREFRLLAKLPSFLGRTNGVGAPSAGLAAPGACGGGRPPSY